MTLRAAVVGGGITGLAAARRLLLAGARVTVLEQSPRWGGKLDRTVVEDLGLDTGAESVLARRAERYDEIARTGRLDFLPETAEIRESEWTVPAAPAPTSMVRIATAQIIGVQSVRLAPKAT